MPRSLVAMSGLVALIVAGCETVPTHDYVKGQRIETTRELGAQIVLIYGEGRRSRLGDVLLREGLVLVVAGEAEPGTTAIPFLPAAYRGFESRFVSERSRRQPGYRGYIVELQLEAIRVGTRRIE